MDDMKDKILLMDLDAYNQLLKEKAGALKNLADALKDFHSQPEKASPDESENCPENQSEKKLSTGKNLLKSKKQESSILLSKKVKIELDDTRNK